MRENHKKLLICDLDNTLYDWIAYFVPSFYAMVDAVVTLTGFDREEVLDEFQKIHIRHGDSEHPFALLEIQKVRDLFKGLSRIEIARALDPAFHAFNSERKKRLKLHSGVKEGLERLSLEHVRLVAHTESKLYATIDRLNRLDILKYFSRIYCRERSFTEHPDPDAARRWTMRYETEKVVELSHHQQKPNPDVLLEICSDEGFDRSEVAYVGDSIARDILMAKRAEVFSIWAKYGATHDASTYQKLVRISHWTTDDIAREIRLKDEVRSITPDFIAHESFSEVVTAVVSQNIEDAVPI